MNDKVRVVRVRDPSQVRWANVILAAQTSILPHDEPHPVYPSDAVWLAYIGGRVAGFAILSHRSTVTGYLSRAGVYPFARGQGIQRRLIRARIAEAKRRGYEYVVSDTYNNPASANSLIAEGFRMFDPKKPWSAGLHWRRKVN